MTSVPDGWAEFNDTTTIIRGHMAAATGTFSGSFATNNANAVREINLKDGCVSSWYQFTPTNKRDFTFTIPGSPFAMIQEIVIPITFHWVGDDTPIAYQGSDTVRKVGVELYKNGSKLFTGVTGSKFAALIKDMSGVDYISNNRTLDEASFCRFVFSAAPNTPTTFRFRTIGYQSRGTKKRLRDGDVVLNTVLNNDYAEISSKILVGVWKG
ncbi:hypothetical protein [Parendozoicomonas haliclonae]|uniref:Uncharacterized protein n=1 Tax=Parendozoicomonas haliclonae TaxID=1960125 RepID=A0A1X7AEG9_9GAMM|nr:hypothetical protein [Parendozoicomonas haliclonae]SMA33245.1 hypothetical protein EHSB41UT_00245 [Parendozoicomonas haliclonae]